MINFFKVFHSWSFVVILGHSWSLMCIFRRDLDWLHEEPLYLNVDAVVKKNSDVWYTIHNLVELGFIWLFTAPFKL